MDGFEWFLSGPQGSILGLEFFLAHINDLSGDVVCNIAIYADDTTFHS